MSCGARRVIAAEKCPLPVGMLQYRLSAKYEPEPCVLAGKSFVGFRTNLRQREASVGQGIPVHLLRAGIKVHLPQGTLGMFLKM